MPIPEMPPLAHPIPGNGASKTGEDEHHGAHLQRPMGREPVPGAPTQGCSVSGE